MSSHHFALYRPAQGDGGGYVWMNSVSTRKMAKNSIEHLMAGLWSLFHRRSEVKVVRIPCDLNVDSLSEYYRILELRRLNDKPHILKHRAQWPGLYEDVSDERLAQLKAFAEEDGHTIQVDLPANN